MKKLLVIHNIATSYYKNIVFNELYKKYKDFEVLHLAETKSIREWKIDLSDINYPYKVLFKGVLDKVPKNRLFFKIIKEIKKLNPEILYLGGYSDFAYWVSLFYAKLKGIKVIIEMNSNEYGIATTRFKEWLKGLFIKQCDVGITYCDLSKNYLINLGMNKEKIIIKPNVTNNKYWEENVEKFASRRERIQKQYKFEKKNFIYVGRFSEEKNLLFLLDAYLKAKKKIDDSDWGLIMIGDGPQMNDLVTYVRDNKIESVFFEGFIDKEKLPEFFALSDIIVLPSISETWGIVVNEAMASGLGVFISENCGASSGLFNKTDDSNVFCVKNNKKLSDLMIDSINGDIDLKALKKKSIVIIKKFTPGFASDKILEALKLV